MTLSIKIRDAVPDEAEFLSSLALRSKAHWGYSEELVRSFAAELTIEPDQISSDNFSYIVAEDHSSIVGFYAIERENGAEFEMEALFIEPKRIGTGLGRLLMQHAVANVKAQGGKRLLIQGDPNAKGFYLAAGGIRIGDRESGSVLGRYLPLFQIDIQ